MSERRKAFLVRVDLADGRTRRDVVFGEVLDAGLHADALCSGRPDVIDARVERPHRFLTDAEAEILSAWS